MSKKILVIDDDKEMLNLIQTYLHTNGLTVETASDGAQGLQKLEQIQYDLVILDVMMPGDDGFEVCKKLRRTSQVPVIIVTAVSDQTDRIVGLELGADDYVEKPFNPRELLARIRAVLRRSDEKALAPAGNARVLEFADWRLDILERSLIHQSGRREPLSGIDYSILMRFLQNPGKVQSRDTISNLLRGRDASPFDRSIDVQISRLRQKLDDDGKAPMLIKTVRGEGYILATEVHELS